MTPIAKNIIVVDNEGNEYEATYPKRAKGLVKNGRARFISENTICLAVPPEIKTEDNIMAENMNRNSNGQNTETQTTQTLYTVDYILSKIAEIQTETSYLNESIARLSAMTDGDSGSSGSPGNILGSEKAKALGDIVRCRETTNQTILKLYEKMYDDLVAEKSGRVSETEKWSTISKLADIASQDDDCAAEHSDMLDTIRQILRENK